jgi:hypothetical protein
MKDSSLRRERETASFYLKAVRIHLLVLLIRVRFFSVAGIMTDYGLGQPRVGTNDKAAGA